MLLKRQKVYLSLRNILHINIDVALIKSIVFRNEIKFSIHINISQIYYFIPK